MGGKVVNGNGHITSQNRNVSNFSELSVVGDVDVYYTAGPNSSVRVEADDNLMEYIETEMDGTTLSIGTKDNYNLRSSKPLKVYVTAPNINDLEVTGSGNFVAQSKLTADRDMKIEVTGSGEVTATIDAPKVRAEISGSGDVKLSGNTRQLDAEINGSGNIRCFDLLSEETRVEISGSGDAEVFASKRLNLEINGSGGIAYKGTPSISQSVNGSGSVRKAD